MNVLRALCKCGLEEVAIPPDMKNMVKAEKCFSYADGLRDLELLSLEKEDSTENL